MGHSMQDRPPAIAMSLDRQAPLDAAVWPDGVRLHDVKAGHAAEVHDLLTTAYREGGGPVAVLSTWWHSLATDAEFDPDLVSVARDTGFRAVGVAQCWTTAFVKDLAVRPDWRRRGLGRALLLHAFGFSNAGAHRRPA